MAMTADPCTPKMQFVYPSVRTDTGAKSEENHSAFMRHCDRTVGRKTPLGSRPLVKGSESLNGGPGKEWCTYLAESASQTRYITE